jgi:hypothetical protein
MSAVKVTAIFKQRRFAGKLHAYVPRGSMFQLTGEKLAGYE